MLAVYIQIDIIYLNQEAVLELIESWHNLIQTSQYVLKASNQVFLNPGRMIKRVQILLWVHSTIS